MIVLDANILIRAVLGRRVRHLLDTYTAHGVRFYAPDVLRSSTRKSICLLCSPRKGSRLPMCQRRSNISNTSLNQAFRHPMSFLKPTPGSACAVVTRMIGPCWPRHSDWPVLYGPKILTFLERAL